MKIKFNKQIFKISFVIFVLLAVGILCWVIGKPLVKFASEPEKFRIWVDSNGIWGRIAYIGMMIMQIVAAFLPGEPFEMVAGYAFGAIEGTILCFLASSLGSVMVLLFVRRFGMKFVSLFFKKEQIESVKFLRSSPKRILLFALIFILPGTPKDLLCYFAGVTDIKMWILILICSFGRIPAIVTSTIGGDALGSKSYILAIIVFAITVLISLSGVSIYKVISFRHNKNEK
ncbi:MAG: TVP38/TMEM64 family protein [Ruminococcaceae bacterium]|nr:TVP38/TMEM64 family protein [Oscillospiraceae bacterium]